MAFPRNDIGLTVYIFYNYQNCIIERTILPKIYFNHFSIHFNCDNWNAVWQIRSNMGFKMVDILSYPNVNDRFLTPSCFENEYQEDDSLFSFKFSISTIYSYIIFIFYWVDRIYAFLENTLHKRHSLINR